MLRINMAVPATPRNDPKFSSLGLVQAAVLGLTDPAYNGNTSLQFIPNMDGFPNGRRLEDDVTRIELQAVSGIVLAAIGLFYDDYPGTGSPITPQLLNVLTYSTKVEKNDTTLKSSFPYEQTPWPGTCDCAGIAVDYTQPAPLPPTTSTIGLASPELFATTAPNPFVTQTTIRYRVETPSMVTIAVYDVRGNMVKALVNQTQDTGIYSVLLNSSNLTRGVYFVKVVKNGIVKQTLRVIKK
jgi:hypothetical protein